MSTRATFRPTQTLTPKPGRHPLRWLLAAPLLAWAGTAWAGTSLNMNKAGQSNVTCYGGTDGSASVEAATGGAGSYTYDWEPGSPSGDGSLAVTGLASGEWVVTVTDGAGNTFSQSFTVTEPTAVVATASLVMPTSCPDTYDGAATVTAAGGTPPYSYQWSNGATSVDINGLAAGTYSVTVYDIAGCSGTGNTVVSAPFPITVNVLTQTDDSCSPEPDGTLEVSASGGTGSFSYEWSGNPTGDGSPSILGLAPGDHTVTVTDENLCTAMQTFTVGAGDGPNDLPEVASWAVSTPAGTPVTITLTGTDADCDVLTFSVSQQPSHGSVTGAPPNITYTPAAGFSGVDTFEFVASDGTGDSYPGTWTITVGPGDVDGGHADAADGSVADGSVEDDAGQPVADAGSTDAHRADASLPDAHEAPPDAAGRTDAAQADASQAQPDAAQADAGVVGNDASTASGQGGGSPQDDDNAARGCACDTSNAGGALWAALSALGWAAWRARRR